MSSVKDLIVPPPEVRAVIDKTAEFVAKMGDEFEKKVIAQQGKEKKFSFLLVGSPYRKYYDLRVRELLEGKEASKTAIPKALMDYKRQQQTRLDKLMLRDVPVIELPPPAEDVFTVNHPPMTSLDLDVIRITAQFVARNGMAFMHGLSAREIRNPQFEFLNESHQLYPVFSNLVNAYTRVILLSPDLRAKLDACANNPHACVSSCMQRYQYESQERSKLKKRAKREAETRQMFSSVDWDDFTVVETINFDPHATYAAPFKVGEVAPIPALAATHVEHEEELHADEPVPAGIKIVTDYTRKRKTEVIESAPKMVKCPITGQQVEADKLSEHLRVVLLDPQWKKQKELLIGRAKLSGPSVDIAASLADFVGKRPDLFGVTEQVESEVRPIGPSMPAPPMKKSKL